MRVSSTSLNSAIPVKRIENRLDVFDPIWTGAAVALRFVGAEGLTADHALPGCRSDAVDFAGIEDCPQVDLLRLVTRGHWFGRRELEQALFIEMRQHCWTMANGLGGSPLLEKSSHKTKLPSECRGQDLNLHPLARTSS